MRLPALRNLWLLCRLAVAAFAVPCLAAQQPARATFVLIGSETEERQRLGALLGDSSSSGLLLRSPSRGMPWAPDSVAPALRFLARELRIISNSALPLSQNDGALHASRGLNAIVTAGLEIRLGPARLLVAPQFMFEQNEPFQVIQFPQNTAVTRSVWANPFHPPPESIDLPLRFGDEPRRRVDPGQSSVTVPAGPTELGLSTENLWWGPGIRNAIVLGNNAAGFPHLFVRSGKPLRTRYGALDFDVVLGRLQESPYFDPDPANDERSLAGGALSWQPEAVPGLRLGFTRLRMGGVEGHDQMSSLFGQWIFPTAGLEMYTEWARFEDPASLRDFLEFPSHSQGYTLGLQWARPLARARTFRFQAEVSYLEPSSSIRVRPVLTSYTSATVPQGFTQLGEVLGAAIGPGSSSQWVAGDVFSDTWRVGVFAGRQRNDNGVLYEPIVPVFKLQDVSILGGVRASRRYHDVLLCAEFTDTARLNYLFQAYIADPVATTSKGIDIGNRTLSLNISYAPGR